MSISTTGFSLVGIWNRSSEPPSWVADRLMTFMGITGESLQVRTWSVSGENQWDWDGTRGDLQRLIEEHPYLNESGAASPENGYESIYIEGETPHGRVIFNFDAGDSYISENIPVHRFSGDFDFVDEGLAQEFGEKALIAFALAFDPMHVSLSTIEVILKSHGHNWGFRSGYRVWISKESASLTAIPGSIQAEPLGNGTLLSIPDAWGPEKVAGEWHDFLAANQLGKIDKTLVQPMEIQLPPEDDPGPIPDSVPVATTPTTEEADPVTAEDYRQQITGWLPDDQGNIPTYVIRDSSPAGLPVRYEGRTLRGPEGDQTEVMLTSVFHVDHLATDPMSDRSALTAANLLSIASWQINALPQGARLEWHCDTSQGATAVRDLLAVNALTAIHVAHTPAIGAQDA